MAVSKIRRGPAVSTTGWPTANAIRVDPTTDVLVFGTGASGTAEKTVVDTASSLLVGAGAIQVATVNLAGATWHTGNGAADYLSWPAPADVVVTRVVVNITTKSTGAATADIGTTAVSAITNSDTLLDGVDIGTAANVFDNFASGAGTNGKSVKTLASGKWITFHALADPTGLVGKAYIYYFTP